MKNIVESVKSDDVKSVKDILKADQTKINARDETGQSLLGQACRNMNTEMMKLLIENGVDVNAADKNEIAPVHILASRGFVEGMAILLEENIDVNAVANTGFTALHYVNAPGRVEERVSIIRQLLEKGAKGYIANKNGDAPLNFAVEFFMDIQIVKALYKYADAYTISDRRALLLLKKAAEYGLKDLFMDVFQGSGEDVLQDEKSKDELVESIVKGGETDFLDILQQHNVQMREKKNVYGWTLAHHAARSGNPRMLRYLYEQDFDISVRNYNGDSPFNIAQKQNDTDMMNQIIELGGKESESVFPELKGKYLGQKTPGMIPEIFAPGIVSTEDYEGCSGWGKDMAYFIFQRWDKETPKLYIMNCVDGIWQKPETIPFGEAYGIGDFTVSPDGNSILFATRRDMDGNNCEWANIWKAEKTESGWSKPKIFDAPIHSNYQESYPCLAANGNLYFFSWRPGGYGKSDLYLSEFKDGIYLEPVNLGNTLNSINYEWDAYIAPDESYIIFSSVLPGGRCDNLHISFKMADGNWTRPQFMAGINSEYSDNRPYVTPDGKYLFFYSGRTGNGDIYWVDAKVIEKFKASSEGGIR